MSAGQRINALERFEWQTYTQSMDFDWQTIMLSFVISTIGFGYFTYGRKRPAYGFMISGVIMMIYAFVYTLISDSVWVMLAIGTLLIGGPFFVRLD